MGANNFNPNSETKGVPTNKTELILYRLDGIDKKLVDLQVLMTQTALQEQRIAALEADAKQNKADEQKLILLEAEVMALKKEKESRSAKWWQIVVIALSPIISAVVMFALMGGLANAK